MKGKRFSRRDFLRLGTLTAASAALAACASEPVKETVVVEKESAVEQVVVTATPKPKTLYIWSHWTPPRDEALQKSLDAFMELHPWITVKHQLLPQVGAQEKILTAIAGGQPPDVLMLSASLIPKYVDQAALTALDRFMDRDGVDRDAWFASDMGPNYYRDILWALPNVGGGTKPLFCNLGHFEEVGLDQTAWPPAQSWEDLEALAEKLNVVKNGEIQRIGFYPICRGGYFPKETDYYWFMVFNGGRAVSEDGRTAVFDQPYREAMQWLVDFTDNYCGGFETAQAFMEFARGGSAEFNAPFYLGNQSISISGPWEFTIVPEVAPEMRYDLFQIPYGSSHTDDFVMEFGGTWTWVIPNGVADRDAAWELLSWLSYEDGCGIFTRNMLRPPALKREAATDFWSENIPQWDHYVDALSRVPPAKKVPSFPGFSAVRNDAMEAALLHTMTVDEACDWAIEEGQLLIDEYWETQA